METLFWGGYVIVIYVDTRNDWVFRIKNIGHIKEIRIKINFYDTQFPVFSFWNRCKENKRKGGDFICGILGCVLGMCVVFCRIFFIYLLRQNK